MKRSLLLGFSLMISTNVFSATDHYFLRDGNHVQHLKITTIDGETTVSMDVDFEPTGPAEQGKRSCSAEVSGEAKRIDENRLILKKQAEGEALYCELTIDLSTDGAKVSQSENCSYFAAGLCRFSSDEREMKKIK